MFDRFEPIFQTIGYINMILIKMILGCYLFHINPEAKYISVTTNSLEVLYVVLNALTYMKNVMRLESRGCSHLLLAC